MNHKGRWSVLVAVLLIAMLAMGGAANADTTSKTYLGADESLVMPTPWFTTHWDDVWDLTQGDLTLSYTVDMNNVLQPGTWQTYNGTTLYAEIGLVGEGAETYFNPGTAWATYQGSCGGWMVHDDDTWNDGDGFTERGNPDPDSILDLDDKFGLQASGGRGEGDYDVLLSDPDTVLASPIGSGSNYGIWFDRDGVDPWQDNDPLTPQPGGSSVPWSQQDGRKTYDTGGIYDIVITYHAINDGLGVMFATVNGVPQGFYTSYHEGEPDYYPAGLSFKGDMKHMQVFAGVWGPNYDDWALAAFGDLYKTETGYYFDYGSVTVSDMIVEGVLGESAPLTPAFTHAPDPVFEGDTIQFDASSTQGGMAPYTFKWDFNNDGTVDLTTTDPSDPAANYSFAVAGTYSVKLTVEPFRCYPKTLVKTVTVEVPTGNLTVVKFNDLNGNGLFDDGEEPIPEWPISVLQNDVVVAQGVTGADGTITFTLPVGDYIVREDTSDAQWLATTPTSVAVTVEQGEGPYLSMYADAYTAGGAEVVTLDPYNPPNHAMRLNPANALGPFDALQGTATANEKFFGVASQTWSNYTFAETFFNVDGAFDIEFAEVTWGSWHAEAAKVYLTGAYVRDGSGEVVPYGATDDGIGYYAGVVWNREGINNVAAARRLEITEGFFSGSRDFAANVFYTDGNFGVSGFNLPDEVVYATGVTLVDVTSAVHTEYNPASYLNVSGVGQRVTASSLSPFAFTELGVGDGNTDGYDLDAIRVYRPVTFGNKCIAVDLAVVKSGPVWAKVGDEVTYTYEVSNNGPASAEPTLVDDTCGIPTAVDEDEDGYNDGDLNNDGLVNPGETWTYSCTVTPAVAPYAVLTNTATVSPADDSLVDTDLSNNTDTYSLYWSVLRKDVLLYWQGMNVQYPDPTTEFTFEMWKDDVLLGTFTIKESAPVYFLLSEGSYIFKEIDVPEGYEAARGQWSWTVAPGKRLDMSMENLIHFDLAVVKSGPIWAEVGDEIIYEYTVTNAGPAAVTPVLWDDNGTPADPSDDFQPQYISGDLNSDGKIQPDETWTYEATCLPAVSPYMVLINTATVHDLEQEVYEEGHWYKGGDTDLSNNTDTYSLYWSVLRKDVLLYWQGHNVDYPDPTDVFFTVEMYKKVDGAPVYLETLTINRYNPAYLWVSEGEYVFLEVDVPEGYTPAREKWSWTVAPGNRLDMSVENLIRFDLAVQKTGPTECVMPGATITYEYTVTNAGPAAVTPVLWDDNGTPADPSDDFQPQYVSGDDNLDGKIQFDETWTYTAEYVVSAEAAGTDIVNVVTVKDAEDDYGDGWKLGGDTDLSNNTDTWTVAVCAYGYLEAIKYYDANFNGAFDEGEPLIPGWKIQVWENGALVESGYTGADGSVTFTLLPGLYQVHEVMPVEAYWMAMNELEQSQQVTEHETASVSFGNLCLGAGGGLTPGYWSNKNGEESFLAIVDEEEETIALQALRDLNLWKYEYDKKAKSGIATEFDPESYAEFKAWLQDRNAVDMRYQLSAHLAAMTLNVMAGFVDAEACVYAGGELGFKTVSWLLEEANLALNPENAEFDFSYLELLKNAIDAANNNLNFVQAAPCSFSYLD